MNHALRAPATASSNQAAFPPRLATDGLNSTFWVSQNPATQAAPQWLEVDLGQDREISLLVMTPRPNFGPRDLVWQVPDGSGWREVARAVAARSGPSNVVIPPVTTSRIRLVLTAGHDPRNVQVAQVHAGPVGSGNRGAAVYPVLDASETERLAATLHQPAVPDGWSALFAVAPDRTGRLAVGLDADLLLVDGNALTDVSALLRVARVVLRGRGGREGSLRRLLRGRGSDVTCVVSPCPGASERPFSWRSASVVARRRCTERQPLAFRISVRGTSVRGSPSSAS